MTEAEHARRKSIALPVAVVGILSRDGRFLVIRRGPDVVSPGYWAPPSGRIEEGESEEEALVRELAEELGVEALPRSKVWQCPSDDGNFLLHWWTADMESDRIVPEDTEVAEVRWVTPDEFLELQPTFTGDRYFFERVLPSRVRAVGPPVIVEYDPEWPARFEAEAVRIREALRDAAVRIEHVGSTAVPGLAAKDIIDIQISVPSMDRELYEEQLESLGYTSVWDAATPEHHFFGRPYTTRPRLFNVHVCPVGSEWERRHLAFRDHLRTNPEAAARYEAFKREVAPRYDDTLAYTDAKDDFIRELEAEIDPPSVRSDSATP